MKYQIPLYMQLYETIVSKINSGEYIAGQMLDSERTLASNYSINRETVKKALSLLERDEFVTRIQGKGTFVNKKKEDIFISETGSRSSNNNVGITASLKTHGIKTSNKVIVCEIANGLRRATKKLRIHDEDDVFILHRVRYGNNDPISIEYVYSPTDIMDDKLLNINFEESSYYDYLKKLNHLPVQFRRVFKIVKCSKFEANLLNIPIHSPVFLFEDLGRDKEGRVIEYVRTYIRTDKMRISFNSYVEDN